VIILSEKTLRAAGVDVDTAVALVGKKEGELVVHIMDWHDPSRIAAPSEPSAEPGDPPPHRPSEAISSLVQAAAPHNESDGYADPARALNIERRAALPPSLEDIQAASLTAAHRLGIPKLPERGVSFMDLQRVASALGVEATLLLGDAVHLKGKFGEGSYGTFASAAAALNARSFKPGGT